jgi:flavin reductase (DIM6/NTAB) family NADH-FMN oxidoreductase RutF
VERGDELRAAMRRFPAGVAVATVDAGTGQPLGLTLGSVVSLSLEPPLLGIAVSRQAALHELLREAGGFSLSLLAAGQTELAQHFSRGMPPLVLWQGIASRPGARGPLLDGALAWIDCALDAEHEAGTHSFFVGAVERVELGLDAAPLVRLGGGYADR